MNIKRRNRYLFFVLAAALLFVLAGSTAAHAAAKKPVTPPGAVKVSVLVKNETQANVSWKKAKGASGYLVIEKRVTNGVSRVTQLTTSKTSVKRKYVEGTHYYYQVRAYKKSGKTKLYGALSNTAELYIPKQMSSLSVKKYEGNDALLGWDTADGAVGYRVYLYDPTSATKKYEVIGETAATAYVVKGLKMGITYQALVRPIMQVKGQKTLGDVSNVTKINIMPIMIPSVHGRYWKATVKTPVTAIVSETGKKIALKKGTALICAARTSGTVFARVTGNPDNSSALLVKVSGKALRFGNLAITSPSYVYTTVQKENFVNAKGISSRTKWMVMINQFTCTVTVFTGEKGRWVQTRTSSCVVGEHGRTSTGTFRIIKKSGHKLWFTWSARFDGGNAFHGFVDSRRRGAYSHGCVRVPGDMASYLAKNVPTGSTVFSF